MGFFNFLVHCVFIMAIALFFLGAVFNMQGSTSRIEGVKCIAATGVLVLLYYLFVTFKSPAPQELPTVGAPTLSTEAASVRTTLPPEPESVTTTIENYRFKGDSIKIECSGPTGSIVCKPVK